MLEKKTSSFFSLKFISRGVAPVMIQKRLPGDLNKQVGVSDTLVECDGSFPSSLVTQNDARVYFIIFIVAMSTR